MEKNQGKLGIFYAIIAYFIWGLFPIYWKYLQEVSADEILANRIIWSFVFMAIILTCTKKWKQFSQTLSYFKKHMKQGILLFIASLLISGNWFIYIFAVNANKIIETSLGYYINPLVSMLLGILVLKEKLTKVQQLSVVLATIGVLIMTFSHGAFPWISISLALTFGLYGLAKKLIIVDAEIGLTLETLLISPFALLYIGYLFFSGNHAFLHISFQLDSLIILSGVFTAVPLLFFAKGAQRIPLSMLGFIQYLTPTLTLILGTLVYHEPFTYAHFFAFLFIWTALLIYSLSKTGFISKRRKKVKIKHMAS